MSSSGSGSGRKLDAGRGRTKPLRRQTQPLHGTMEGQGAYNRYARLQANGAALAIPLLEQAVRKIEIGAENSPVVIADYGSSQGKNSMAPMRAAIGGLRERLGPKRPILVAHIDRPANDFTTLFAVLDGDPNRYSAEEPNTFSCAVGKSFYSQVLPSAYVHLGWCAYAAVWLSRLPMPIPGHFVPIAADEQVRAAFARQAAEDWKAFLSARARELLPGGRLILVLPGADDKRITGFEEIFGCANRVLAELVEEGALSKKERARMALAVWPRTRRELLAPFEANGSFEKLSAEHYELSVMEDAGWAAYQNDGDKESLAIRHTLFFRATFLPSLATALDRASDAAEFGTRLESALKRQLLDHPIPMRTNVQTIVLAKQNSAS
jgi:SAM dependent carboxyl methyltransferase